MQTTESLSEFYKRKEQWLPESLKNELGHFNIFTHVPVSSFNNKPLPYRKRDFYKIMLVKGNLEMNYADRVIHVKKQAILFSNPLIPYNCANLEAIESGIYCIFNSAFFLNYGNFSNYEIFQPAGKHVFELTDEQAEQVGAVFAKMENELGSDYNHKYDVIRNLIFELIHFANKMQPAQEKILGANLAAKRIATLFVELLERQFPIEENHPQVNLRTASAFADQLNVHVNHLNRSVKEITGKTSSQLIAERFGIEAKKILSNTFWPVADVAFALGFKEVSHFNNFFKKNTGISPSMFRKSLEF